MDGPGSQNGCQPGSTPYARSAGGAANAEGVTCSVNPVQANELVDPNEGPSCIDEAEA